MLKDIYNIAPRETIRDRDWIMPFGKFKGTPLHEIIETDSQYLVWLVNNTDLDLHADIMDEIENQSEAYIMPNVRIPASWQDD